MTRSRLRTGRRTSSGPSTTLRDAPELSAGVSWRWDSPRPPRLPDSLLGYLSVLDWGDEGPARELRANEWIVGCNIAFDKDLLLSLGGFSRALGRIGTGGALLSSEEIDVIERLQRAGRPA